MADARPAWEGHAAEDFDLILEGGSMRGLFTGGVCDFFMEQGLFPKNVWGTSAGSMCGYNYVAGAIGFTALVNMRYCTDWRYLSLRNFIETGSALGTEIMFHDIPAELAANTPGAFYGSPTRLWSVASDIDLGDADYHLHDDPATDPFYLQASASMPVVARVVHVDGKRLLDGGICDSVPYVQSRMRGARRQVVVLTREDGFVKRPNPILAAAMRAYPDCPQFIDRMAHRHFEYNLAYRRLKRLHEAGEVFVVRPRRPVEVDAMEHDPEKLLDLYAQGYREAAENWEGIQRYLGL